MPQVQSFKSHVRWDPVFHFFLAPVLLADIVLAIYVTVRDWPLHSRSHLWWIVMAVALFVLAGLTRGYSNKNQDRIIRLEERLRMAALLSSSDAAAAQALTTGQLIALRFASDDELPALVRRALGENLAPKEIKRIIVVWRADHHRI